MSSSNIVLFGGSGKVARHITRMLAANGHTVHSVIRNPDQKAEIEKLGGTPVIQSIEEASVDDMANAITQAKGTAVIWSAGAGGGSPERTKSVDNEGAIKSMDATAKAGVKRYIIVSAIDVRDRENKPEPEWYNHLDRQRSDKVWSAIGVYMQAKLAADRSLVTENGRRKLDFTIVRPGGLSNDPGTGKVDAGRVHLDTMISREDVASVVVECLKNDGTQGLAFDCVGGDTPVAEAVEGVAKGNIDCFGGRY